jgi:hypothetical protein
MTTHAMQVDHHGDALLTDATHELRWWRRRCLNLPMKGSREAAHLSVRTEQQDL